jgi:hypothetical protein
MVTLWTCSLLTSGGCEDKVDVITPANILFRGVANFTVMMIMIMMMMMMIMIMIMMIVSVEQRPGWGGHFFFNPWLSYLFGLQMKLRHGMVVKIC